MSNVGVGSSIGAMDGNAGLSCIGGVSPSISCQFDPRHTPTPLFLRMVPSRGLTLCFAQIECQFYELLLITLLIQWTKVTQY